MKTIIVDGLLHGTGIRDRVEGGYLDPGEIGLTKETILTITNWLSQYEEEHYNHFSNPSNIEKLDLIGFEIAKRIEKELPDFKVGYYSNALLKELTLDLNLLISIKTTNFFGIFL